MHNHCTHSPDSGAAACKQHCGILQIKRAVLGDWLGYHDRKLYTILNVLVQRVVRLVVRSLCYVRNLACIRIPIQIPHASNVHQNDRNTQHESSPVIRLPTKLLDVTVSPGKPLRRNPTVLQPSFSSQLSAVTRRGPSHGVLRQAQTCCSPAS